MCESRLPTYSEITAMSDETAVALAGVITFAFGGAGTYCGLALIRNLHDFNDRLLKNYADHPGGWRRSDHHDPSQSTDGVGFGLSFEYAPKTPRQAAVVGWVIMLVGLLMVAAGLLLIVAGLLGQVE